MHAVILLHVFIPQTQHIHFYFNWSFQHVGGYYNRIKAVEKMAFFPLIHMLLSV